MTAGISPSLVWRRGVWRGLMLLLLCTLCLQLFWLGRIALMAVRGEPLPNVVNGVSSAQ